MQRCEPPDSRPALVTSTDEALEHATEYPAPGQASTVDDYTSESKEAAQHTDQALACETLPGDSVEWSAGRQEYMILITLAIVSLMVSLDATIIVPTLPAITLGLNGTANDAFWTGTSYLLASAVSQPFITNLSDIFGRRDMNLIALAFFTVGTLICCLAQDFTVMLVGRSIQGIGGGGILSLGLVIVTDIIPLRQRPKYYGIIQAAWAIGTISGPLIGGALVENTTWRWVFYITFPFCGIGFILIPLTVKLQTRATSFRHRLLQVDWTGGLLFIAGTTLFLIAITWGGTEFPWGSYQTLVPLILGTVVILISLLWEAYIAKQPVLRVRVFNGISAKAAYICTLAQGTLLFGELYYFPFYLGSVKDEQALQTGVGLLPITCGLVPTSLVVGIIITRVGGLRWAIWTGWILTILSTGLLILFDVSISTPRWASIFVVIGIGHGFILNALNFFVQATASPIDAGPAAATYLFTRSVGMCLGVAIGGTAFQNILATNLANAGLPVSIAANAELYLAVLKQMPSDSPLRIAVVQAYSQAFRGVFIVITGIAALGGIASLFLKEHTLNVELSTDHRLSRPTRGELS